MELNKLMEDAPDYPNLKGEELTNIKYGMGKVVIQNGKYLYIKYGDDERLLPYLTVFQKDTLREQVKKWLRFARGYQM